MNEKQTLYIWERTLILALCVTLLLGAWLPGSNVAGWWCVVFPPLYPGTAAEAMAQDAEPEGDYVIRFRIVELWEQLTGRQIRSSRSSGSCCRSESPADPSSHTQSRDP